jgi:uncharacterized membrane protein YccF (DUF307 family)
MLRVLNNVDVGWFECIFGVTWCLVFGTWVALSGIVRYRFFVFCVFLLA